MIVALAVLYGLRRAGLAAGRLADSGSLVLATFGADPRVGDRSRRPPGGPGRRERRITQPLRALLLALPGRTELAASGRRRDARRVRLGRAAACARRASAISARRSAPSRSSRRWSPCWLGPWLARLGAQPVVRALGADSRAGARRCRGAPARLGPADAHADPEARRRPARGRGTRTPPGARASPLAVRRVTTPNAATASRRCSDAPPPRSRSCTAFPSSSSSSATHPSTRAWRRSCRPRARR